jgi:hypothetical protein
VALATYWVTISALATAGGTFVLAIATFTSVRSANRAARAAERSLLAGLRPLLIPSRLDDASQKIAFQGDKWLVAPGGQAVAETSDEVVYLAATLRNVGTGIAVLHGWRFYSEISTVRAEHPSPEEFTRLTRDLYIPVGDVGFWQGTFRDPARPEFAEARAAIEAHGPWSVDVLYGDAEGGQRVISRFAMLPRDDGNGARWLSAASRHWNVDRSDPRELALPESGE